MLKHVEEKINHMTMILGAKGILLLVLGCLMIAYPQIVVWMIIILVFLGGFTCLFLAHKMNSAKKSFFSKLPKMFK